MFENLDNNLDKCLNRQTMQTQIRLLLKEQSGQGMHCFLFLQTFCEVKARWTKFYLRAVTEESIYFEHLLYVVLDE